MRGRVTTALEIIGLGLMVCGVSMLSLVAGLIFAGFALIIIGEVQA